MHPHGLDAEKGRPGVLPYGQNTAKVVARLEERGEKLTPGPVLHDGLRKAPLEAGQGSDQANVRSQFHPIAHLPSGQQPACDGR